MCIRDRDIRVKDEEKKASLGNRVMENLNEVNLYLPATCELEDVYKRQEYDQTRERTAP